MGLMDRLNQAKCATGMHAGDWQWLAEGNCGQVRTCARCGNVAKRDNHSVTKWAFTGDAGNPCLMERHCERCLDGETQVQHAPQFQYQSDLRADNAKSAAGAAFAALRGPDGCRGQYACARCGYTDGRVSQQHVWGQLYKPDAYSRYQRACLRCGRVDKSSI
jgi:hypothetical protein